MTLIGYKFVIKSTARFKGILREHPLTKTMDGIHRRLIHLAFRFGQEFDR